MKSLTALTFAALSIFATSAIASGTHDGGHAAAGAVEEYSIGTKGDKAKAKRNINISLRETDDGEMLIEPKVLMFRKGETVALNFTNVGKTDHEFVMDTEEAVQEHKKVMEKNPDMVHADDNTMRLAPGEKGQIVWTFSKDGNFTFACLIPGHYEAGMHGIIKISK